MRKMTVVLLLALLTTLGAVGVFEGRVYLVRYRAQRHLTVIAQDFMAALGRGAYDETFKSVHDDFSKQQTIDELSWYAEWMKRQLGPLQETTITRFELTSKEPPFQGMVRLLARFEKGACETEVLAETVEGTWRILSAQVQVPTPIGNFACPQCDATSKIVRRVCAKCGAQILSIPDLPILPEALPDSPVDPQALSRYATVDCAAEWRPRLYVTHDFKSVGRAYERSPWKMRFRTRRL